MNISEMIGSLHPAIVHLPIGMLTLYAVLEILPLKRLESHASYRYTKGIIVCAGVVGVMLALQSGEAAAEMNRHDRAILELHELMASTTMWFFGILAGIYAIAWLRDVEQMVRLEKFPLLKKVWDILSRVANALDKPLLRRVLALFGFVALSLTGILGGALVYGTDTDFLVSFVTKLLGLQ